MERGRKKIITGTATKFRSMIGSEQLRHLFIYHVRADTELDDVRDYIKEELNREVKALVKVSNKDARNQSFRLTVSATDYDGLEDSEVWPEGIKVRRFIFPPRDRVKAAESDHSTGYK